MPTLRDIMTPDPVTVDPMATLKEVATLMLEQDIGSVLVVENDRPTGIITDRDIVIRAVAYGHDFGTPVTDYTTGDVFTMDANASIEDAAREMADRQLHRIPVTENGRLVGMVSLGDLANRTVGGMDQEALEGISVPTDQ
ncbi:CBS domain-containing protein [Deinococcus metallilatus]|uniref:CBS domain-containing protein n=1 Tax=Deinococcus metallilatus TaxID=1211322 RepID=A0AAJ5F0R6_9DEIO|nr:CBS domain-containing protein [Deinococcus metallilatus]MBB5296160.1 CBS domain-containing protein [Deinococcus metallilatus]QBY09789.1 CBS domain-containing protein [Deinococcus metallilatus]RXJ08787.1 CBS domain-containing protein [Deinococcus metallilatus]TLK23266.1 CBS domain-containing protein [Deinococcus metallilatus]GMA14026.1 CBS domain-containing protein [Deinococcus metallilatus]